jgi:uncharacterized protein YuzE
MREPYLEVTFRHGRALAAYLYLPRKIGAKSQRTRRVEPGLIIDFDSDGQPIGIELTAPTRVGLADLNLLLAELGSALLTDADLAPLKAA